MRKERGLRPGKAFVRAWHANRSWLLWSRILPRRFLGTQEQHDVNRRPMGKAHEQKVYFGGGR
jgi:hypothetical protein